jgi:hypothetical protein
MQRRRLSSYKVREWLDHWLEMKEKVGSRRALDRYRQVICDFIDSLGNRANLALSHITPKDVVNYRNSITAAGKTARMANLSIKVVNAAFDAAVRQHLIDTNPATAIESLDEDFFLDEDREVEEVAHCYSVGDYGPFTIMFYRQDGKYFYMPLECGEEGPYDSLEAALEAAETDVGSAVGGFWKTLEEAEKHAAWMRDEGYLAG